MARLIFVLEEGEEVVVPLAGVLTLGREEDNDIVIDDERISRHHAEIVTHGDGRIEILDIGSTAGTRVNDRPIRSHFVQVGDKIAFGHIIGRIEPDSPPAAAASAELEEKLTKLKSDISSAEAKHRELAGQIDQLTGKRDALSLEVKGLDDSLAMLEQETSKLTARQKEEAGRLSQLGDDRSTAEKELAAIRDDLAAAEEQHRKRIADKDSLESEVRSLSTTLDQLTSRQKQAVADFDQADAEAKTRSTALLTASQRLDELDSRIQQATDQLSALQEQAAAAQRSLQQSESRLSESERAANEARAAETAAKDRIAGLSARESELRAEIDGGSSGIALAREELSGLESRLAPLRDWKKSMDEHHARLAAAAPGSEAETAILQQIEEGFGTLFDLLPAARIDTQGVSRSDFVRARTKAGVPMKSDRIRRSGS